LCGLNENLRRVGDLERQVLHVDLLDLEGGALRLLLFAHLLPSNRGSSSPWRSRAWRSSQPPTWRSPIQICGTGGRPPAFCVISARSSGRRSTRIFSICAPFASNSRSAD